MDVVLDERGIATEGKVLGYKDRIVLLLLPTQRQLERPIEDVRKITLADQPDFTQAEMLRSEKKYDQALEAYQKAARRARADWLKQLIADRRYQALLESGQLDKAIKAWLGMMDESNRSEAAQRLMPKTFGPAGSKANAQAIKLLDSKVESLSGSPKKNQAYIVQLLKLKMKIQQVDGDTAGLAKTLEQIDRVTGKTSPDASAGSPTAAPARDTALMLLDGKFKVGKYAEVRQEIESNFKSYRRADRPAALLLLARSQRELAREAADRDLLIEAGLNFMTVFCEYSGSAQATEALYRAAEVNQALNNQPAARAALRELIDQYGSAKDPWVDKARTALEGQ
jgi:tetratricopeptide (TPR) repeat protein